MLVTQSIQIRGLTAEQYEILRYQCRLAKNMYNVGLYTVRQFFFAENRFLAYESNYHHCKANENLGKTKICNEKKRKPSENREFH